MQLRGFFYHNKHVISEGDVVLINDFEREYLFDKSYDNLKQLNIIKMVFDIRKESAILSSFPVHIQLEHTTYCNARCIMCDHYIAHNRGSKHLKLSSVKRLESLLPYVSMIIMHGNGEPLINPDILQIFSLYEKYKVQTSLNTNLSYLNDDILSLIRDNCKSIHISCDGCNEQQYEYIRQGLSYKKFISNIKRVEFTCSNTEKVLEVVLMRQNIQDAKEFVRFAYNHGFSKVIFNPLGCNEWIGNQKDGLRNFISTAVFYCRLAKEEGIRLGVNVLTPFEKVIAIQSRIVVENHVLTNEDYKNLVSSDVLHKMYPWYSNTIAFEQLNIQSIIACNQSMHITGMCEYPFAKTYIDLCGNISFCCPASRKIVDTISNDKSFEDIWNCDMYQEIRKSFYKKRMPLLCENCNFIENGALQFLTVG